MIPLNKNLCVVDSAAHIEATIYKPQHENIRSLTA